jgi:hypothetical protein
MIIVTIDDHRLDLLQILVIEVFLRMMVIVSDDVISPGTPDREGLFSREG